jgi:hypothetical protein
MVSRRELQPAKKITLILLPNPDGRKALQLSLSLTQAMVICGVLATIFLFIFFSFLYSVNLSGKLMHYYFLQSENAKLSEDINVFVEKTKLLEKGVTQLEESERELREMLGLNTKDFTYKKKA